MRSMPSKSKLNLALVNGELASCRHRRDDLHMQGIVFALVREPRIPIAYAMSGTAVPGVRAPARA